VRRILLKNQQVAVIGGGNTAAEEASTCRISPSRYACTVERCCAWKDPAGSPVRAAARRGKVSLRNHNVMKAGDENGVTGLAITPTLAARYVSSTSPAYSSRSATPNTQLFEGQLK
jgi:thioredoxin reductase